MTKNAKMEKADLILSTFVQYVEDFKFWVNVARRPHRIPDKEIAKCFVNGLKPVLFREEMYSRPFENFVPSFKKKGEANSSKGTSFSDHKKPGNFSAKKT